MKAIFNREFHWRHPETKVGFGAKVKDEPQSFPSDFVKAAIAAGAAVEVKRKPKED